MIRLPRLARNLLDHCRKCLRYARRYCTLIRDFVGYTAIKCQVVGVVFFMQEYCESGATRWQVTSPLRGWFALLSAIALVTTFLPSSVRAECGDYVLRGERGRNGQASPGVMTSAMLGQHEQQFPSRHGEPHKPCRGPHCSQGTPSLPLPVTTAPLTAEQWGCVVAAAPVGDCLSTHRVLESFSQIPRLVSQAIYHPPRSSSSLRLSL